MDCTFDANTDSFNETQNDIFTNNPWGQTLNTEQKPIEPTDRTDTADTDNAHANINTLLEHLRRKEEMLAKREEEMEYRERTITRREMELCSQSGARAENGVSQDIQEENSSILQSIESLRGAIESSNHKDDIIRELHSEVIRHNNNLADNLLRPYLKSIMRIHDRLASTAMNSRDEAFSGRDDAYVWLSKAVEADRLSVEDMLEDEFEVEYFRPDTGERYNPREHTSINSIPTEDENLGGTILECRQGGYRNVQTGRIEKNATVVIYRYTRNKDTNDII